MTCFANECNNDNTIECDSDKFVNIMSEVSKEVQEDEKGMSKTINTIAGSVKLNV